MLRAAVALCLLLACTSAGKQQAASLANAVDAYRHAPGSAKADRGKAVADVTCSEPRVCDAKQACVAAIDPTVRALALKDEVTARIADIEKGVLAKDSPEAQALPGKLNEAERLLKDGRGKMDDCDTKLVELQREYGG